MDQTINAAVGQKQLKLDPTIQDPQERNKIVTQIIESTPSEKLTPGYLKILTQYLVYPLEKEERKQKKILTENRMTTVNKRETSFEGLVEKFQNGEDGIYNMITNDKNIIFTPKYNITPQDIKEIPGLQQLVESIKETQQRYEQATGKKKALLLKQLIQMRKDQYVLKSSYRKPIYFMNAIKSFNNINFEQKITINEDGSLKVDGNFSFLIPEHVQALLCNYSKIKQNSWGKFESDSYYLIQDLQNLIDLTLKDDYALYYDLLIYKIDGKTNQQIQSLLNRDHGIKHSVEYLSSLWRKKIPKMIAERAQKEWLIWHYTNEERGKWKKCNRCGEIKLAHNMFFSKNNTSKDGWYSICKDCRNKKTKEKKMLAKGAVK